MKNTILLLLLFLAAKSWSQPVAVLAVNDTLQHPNYQQFIYLSPTTPVDQAVFVAKLKASGSLRNLSNLFEKLKTKAQSMGANAFQFVEFTAQDPAVGELTLNTFLMPCSQKIRLINTTSFSLPMYIQTEFNALRRLFLLARIRKIILLKMHRKLVF